MRKSLILFIIISFILAGCWGEKTIEFSGKTKNWSVKYISHIYSSNSEGIEYTIRYIGDGPAPKTIDYKLGSNSVTGRTLDDKSFSIKSNGGSCSGCGVTDEHDDIEATIKWNGHKETFILTTE
ncbi:hypothetical protein EV207_1074 [Scopulibacillus darangshiensis]|uniref:Lipoprotein n=1 Tax=Scopulibacillus darangshiensis TaxID=442528 RepID=A0A4R2P504_9BACL|nr:hypothetical protein [Scopulibacillus darangshiensis]TCP29910.1 hypothetical protein EV207_1074 [Scopulibacillus darangshiensis]